MQVKPMPVKPGRANRSPALAEFRLNEEKLEATPGIEPGYTDLQSAASPLRHVAPVSAGNYREIGWPAHMVMRGYSKAPRARQYA